MNTFMLILLSPRTIAILITSFTLSIIHYSFTMNDPSLQTPPPQRPAHNLPLYQERKLTPPEKKRGLLWIVSPTRNPHFSEQAKTPPPSPRPAPSQKP